MWLLSDTEIPENITQYFICSDLTGYLPQILDSPILKRIFGYILEFSNSSKNKGTSYKNY